ncbi:hypothetical protein E4U25_003055 [Claviceps purpurea]|nr:hypothetical protein E4U25_003055 [Claviceps purpurea]
MGSPERRDSLKVQRGTLWAEEEDDLIVQLKMSGTAWKDISLPGRTTKSCKMRYNNYLRSQLELDEEGLNDLARLYERDKEKMWAQVAGKMAVTWSEAEKIHWKIGKAHMAKRGSDDSYLTTRVDLPPYQADDAEAQAQIQQQDQQQQQDQEGLEGVISGTMWSGEEEEFLFANKRSGMGWKEISDGLPGRTFAGCQAHYAEQIKTGPAWPQERKNELCKVYESLKRSMWSKIGEQLKVRWEVAEDMHWGLGRAGMEKRARVTLSSQTAVGLAPPEEDSDSIEVHHHSDEEHDQSSRRIDSSSFQTEVTERTPMAHKGPPGSSMTLPSFAEFLAGVPPQR